MEEEYVAVGSSILGCSSGWWGRGYVVGASIGRAGSKAVGPNETRRNEHQIAIGFFFRDAKYNSNYIDFCVTSFPHERLPCPVISGAFQRYASHAA